MIKLLIVAALVFSTSIYASEALDLSQEAAKELFDKGRIISTFKSTGVDLNNEYHYTSKINVICNKHVEVVTESKEEDSLIEYKCSVLSE